MQNYADKIEMLVSLKEQLTVKEASLTDLEVKSESAEEADIETLEAEAEEVSKSITDLRDQITELDAEIKEIEDAQAAATEATAKRKTTFKKENEKMSNYLETVKAANDWVQMIGETNHRGEFHAKWTAHLEEKGITGDDIFMPRPVLDRIKDFFADYSGVLNYVSSNPNYVMEVDEQTLRAFATGRLTDTTTKVEQNFKFGSFVINAGEIYSLIRMGYAQHKLDQATGGRMYAYVIDQLMKSVVRGVERALLVGTDATLAPYIKAIATETNTDLFSVKPIDLTATSFSFQEVDALVEGIELILAQGAPVVICSKATAGKFRRAKDADGNWYNTNHMAPVRNGVNEILGLTFIVYDFMTDDDLIAFASGSYLLIGDAPTNPDFLTQYDILPDNRGTYEVVGLVGGSLVEYKAATVFEAP